MRQRKQMMVIDAQAVADKLATIEPIVIATKVSKSGSIYGSVNNLHIAEELAKRGFEIDRKIIAVKDVKEVGTYTAVVKLHKEISVEVPFTVIAEGEEAPAPAAEAPAETPAEETAAEA